MSLLLYLAVLLVSISSVLFGFGWLAAPAPHYPMPAVQVASQASAAAKKADKSAGENAEKRVQVVAKAEVKSAAQNMAQGGANDAAGAKRPADAANAAADTQVMTAEPSPACDIAACTLAYRSFRASDCTYQPFDGPRRLCTKGTPPGQAQPKPAASTAPAGIDAQAQAASSCNIAACEAAYRSFNPADCTYQPYDGPRRICDK